MRFPLKSLLSPVQVDHIPMESYSESVKVIDDVISCVALSPHHPDVIVIATGERHFALSDSALSSDDEDELATPKPTKPSSLQCLKRTINKA